MGPSGSSEPSLRRALHRLLEPNSGQVLPDGRGAASLPAKELRRRVGMVFQRPAMVDETVMGNALHGPRLRGRCPERGCPGQRDVTVALLDKVGLRAEFIVHRQAGRGALGQRGAARGPGPGARQPARSAAARQADRVTRPNGQTAQWAPARHPGRDDRSDVRLRHARPRLRTPNRQRRVAADREPGDRAGAPAGDARRPGARVHAPLRVRTSQRPQ